jgi:hypothetical protein
MLGFIAHLHHEAKPGRNAVSIPLRREAMLGAQVYLENNHRLP